MPSNPQIDPQSVWITSGVLKAPGLRDLWLRGLWLAQLIENVTRLPINSELAAHKYFDLLGVHVLRRVFLFIGCLQTTKVIFAHLEEDFESSSETVVFSETTLFSDSSKRKTVILVLQLEQDY